MKRLLSQADMSLKCIFYELFNGKQSQKDDKNTFSVLRHTKRSPGQSSSNINMMLVFHFLGLSPPTPDHIFQVVR